MYNSAFWVCEKEQVLATAAATTVYLFIYLFYLLTYLLLFGFLLLRLQFLPHTVTMTAVVVRAAEKEEKSLVSSRE